MKIKKTTGRIPEFKTGQVWRLGEDRVQIELVGKWLIHYRQYTNMDKKLPTRFAARGDLEKLLSSSKAVLETENESKKSMPAPRKRSVRPGKNPRF
jgi:hypothetical protein